MKWSFPLVIATAMVVLAATNTGCVKVDFNDNEIIDTTGNGGGNVPTTLRGRIDKDLTLPKGKYNLRGFVFVGKGATLTIAAGSVVIANSSEVSALIIEQGGKLMAEGTATEPIVFTSDKPAGSRDWADWGGISICGYAPTNKPLNPPPITEGGSNRPYGGTDPNDNSGSLRYVRVEFAGITAENASELNGFTFYGVGAGTILDHLMTYNCGDDGFEFFGGTVNAKYLVSYESGDDDFDFDNGYSGRIQFAVCLRGKRADNDPANGIECDNDANGSSLEPITRPTLSNFTIIGPYDTTGTSIWQFGYGNRWRRSARFVIRNSIMMGTSMGGLILESDNTINAYKSNLSEFKNNLVHAYKDVYKSGNTAIMTDAEIKAKAEADGCVTFDKREDIKLTDPFNFTNPNFLPATGSPALTGAVFTGLDAAFFTTVQYRGAFGDNNWLQGWTNFDAQHTTY